MARIRRPSLPTVLSILALVIALSGGAYALTIPRNSVGTAQLKADAVTSPKVKNRTLTALDVKTGTFEPDSTIVMLPYRSIPNGGPDQQIIKIGPFTLTARCLTNASNPNIADVFIVFQTAVDNSSIQGIYTNADWDVAEIVPYGNLWSSERASRRYGILRLISPTGWDVDVYFGASHQVFGSNACEFTGYAIVVKRP